jgi:hypothetical protein
MHHHHHLHPHTGKAWRLVLSGLVFLLAAKGLGLGDVF